MNSFNGYQQQTFMQPTQPVQSAQPVQDVGTGAAKAPDID
jgi:hypothetical protein